MLLKSRAEDKVCINSRLGGMYLNYWCQRRFKMVSLWVEDDTDFSADWIWVYDEDLAEWCMHPGAKMFKDIRKDLAKEAEAESAARPRTGSVDTMAPGCETKALTHKPPKPGKGQVDQTTKSKNAQKAKMTKQQKAAQDAEMVKLTCGDFNSAGHDDGGMGRCALDEPADRSPRCRDASCQVGCGLKAAQDVFCQTEEVRTVAQVWKSKTQNRNARRRRTMKILAEMRQQSRSRQSSAQI